MDTTDIDKEEGHKFTEPKIATALIPVSINSKI